MSLETWPAGKRLPIISIGLLSALLFFTSATPPAFAAESQDKKETADAPKESFNLILPFRDLTVGQGQEATMDAEVVNR
ncbi:MAG TPA: hypothetical protein VGL11_22325, partial [Candidatus Binatia bacterium]